MSTQVMKSMQRSLGTCFLALLGLLFVPAAFGQTASTGALTGTVTDPSAAVVPGAQVVVTNIATGQVRTVKTDGTGVYRALLLSPGKYTVDITAP